MINWNASNLDIFIWDVAHGLSITIITPFVRSASGIVINRRRVIQIDAGVNNEYNFRPIHHLVHKRGLQVIDWLILSHPDKDHIDELPEVLKMIVEGKLTVSCLFRNNSIPNSTISEVSAEETEAKTTYKHFNNTYNGVVEPHNALTPLNFGGLEIQNTFLYHTGEQNEHNNLSVVVSVKLGGVQLIIPGDLEEEGVDSLITLGWMPAAYPQSYRILVAPHHGSKEAKPASLLKFYKPHIVLASAEKDHEYTDPLYSSPDYVYGHPVINGSGSEEHHRFSATKGETIHIETYGHYPTIKRIPYGKPSLEAILMAAQRLLSESQS